MRIFAHPTTFIDMRLKLFIHLATFALAFALLSGCQHNPTTATLGSIDQLQRQVKDNAETLQNIENEDYKTLEKDFVSCDSMLQYQEPEEIDSLFERLRLVDAYLKQFEQVAPQLRADMDSTLLQLDRLKKDVETHYLSDSLAAVYLADETRFVDTQSNQIHYFQDRFKVCRNHLDMLMKNR